MPSHVVSAPPSLRRELGLASAVFLGLGSIVGTGVFVGLAVAAGAVGGAYTLLAVVLAGGLATCNGLSSARLAAAHPVAGGTYEYGYRLLTPAAGFVAGWTFLLAKSASAATAALGVAGYTFLLLGLDARGSALAASAAVVGVTLLVAGGVRRTTIVNAVVVCVTLAGLTIFVIVAAPSVRLPAFQAGVTPRAVAEATALIFVAYTGYGRVATLGEEVRDPARTIPRAVVLTLAASGVLYLCVAAAAVGVAGAGPLADAADRHAAPLDLPARQVGGRTLAVVITVAAVTAMLGVLLNLVWGLSRVWLALGRRGDAPAALARVSDAGVPRVAVLTAGAVVLGLVLVGDVRLTWSISAFAVLVYYGLTNLAALRLGPAEDVTAVRGAAGRGVAVAGLIGCVGLAPWVDGKAVLTGVVAVAAGLVLRVGFRRSAATTF